MTQAIAKLERGNRSLRDKDIALIRPGEEDTITLPCYFAGEIAALGISHMNPNGLVYVFQLIALADNPFLGWKYVEGQPIPIFKTIREDFKAGIEPGQNTTMPIYDPTNHDKFLGNLVVKHEKYEPIKWVVAE